MQIPTFYSQEIHKKNLRHVLVSHRSKKKNQFGFTQPKNAHFDINSYFSTLLPVNACVHSLSLLQCVLNNDI